MGNGSDKKGEQLDRNRFTPPFSYAAAPADSVEDAITLLLDVLQRQYNIPYQDLMQHLETKRNEQLENMVPAKLFSDRDAGVLELLVRYLKEVKELPFKDISKLINRDNRTIWATYHKACKKKAKLILPKDPEFFIPLSTFTDRTLGPAECVIHHLHTQERLPFHRIAQILNRNPRTIWTAFHKGEMKIRQNGQEQAEQRGGTS